MAVAALIGMLAFIVNFGLSVDAGADDMSLRFGGRVLLDVAVGLCAVPLLLLRRHAPVTAAIVLAACGTVSAFAVPAALLALASLSTRRRPREIGTVAGVWMLGVLVIALTGFDLVGIPVTGGDLVVTVGIVALVLAGVVAVGVSIGARRALMASLRERAQLVAEDQRLREAAARDHERARIAHEMHDVLAHRLSLTAMHASALRHRADLDPAERRAAVETVDDNARGALRDLREILTVVRDPDSSTPDRPQPTLADLDALVRDENVRLERAVDTSGLALVVSRHAYRIVQECLTNARRHAPGMPVVVRIDGTPGDELRIAVSNDLQAPPPPAAEHGFGLVGVNERARSIGGSVTIDPGPDEFRVSATLPWMSA
ncbi:two-component sensor histidine kinase [Microbacterium radiodurans]|uniref:histidine kinase n=1 Tax=Microbacterium radiodurans TaxID=661398 RepID=A0A5J5IN78_9MICO|nr:two-component sensor histidine kinase [Microbacterium radiodurans]